MNLLCLSKVQIHNALFIMYRYVMYHNIVVCILTYVFTYVSVFAVNQAQKQRLLTVKSLKESQMLVSIDLCHCKDDNNTCNIVIPSFS